ncbi:ShlB/FhaC/HecB family hemolysin secretion/activation protein [Paraherbaspirillum soli]|uniref:ShlB/FhaC/HecB family hemolysin secretion/activation protein n=1 Tax=Paraherbaspirillum soli TaxID=631222 RepID=A0ABW0MDV1_9BURK
MSVPFKLGVAPSAVIAVLFLVLFVAHGVQAQTSPVPAADTATARRQAQQIEEAQESAAARPDVFTPERANRTERLELPTETPCFAIRELEWRGAEPFRWLTANPPIIGACVGAQGLRNFQDWLTRALIARGYITSHAQIPPQNLASGNLIVEIVAGRVGRVSDEGGSVGWQRAALPIAAGDVLNVHDLDQALENMRRLPGQARVAFDLLPGARFAETDIVIKHPAEKRWRALLTAGNTGIDATGRNQLGAIIALDSPLHLYDQLIATYNSDAHFKNDARGSRSKSVSWSVPYGYATFSLSASEWSSRQPVNIGGRDYAYVSRTRRVEAGIGYVLYRTGYSKGSLQFKLNRRTDNTSFGGINLVTQARDITAYGIGFTHRQSTGRASWSAGADLRGSLPGLSRTPGLVADQPNWSGSYHIVSANAALEVPFAIGGLRAAYRGALQAQHAPVPIPSTEYLSIGDRYSVRGFDGNATLAGSGGAVARNELAAGLGVSGQEIYTAVDAGYIAGKTIQKFTGRMLAGAALGVRGGLKTFGYDVMIGMPLVKPTSFKSSAPSLSFFVTNRF